MDATPDIKAIRKQLADFIDSAHVDADRLQHDYIKWSAQLKDIEDRIGAIERTIGVESL